MGLAWASLTVGLVLQVANPGAGPIGSVPGEPAGIGPGESADVGDHAAMILYVVIAVEDDVLAVVLVVCGDDGMAETEAELLPGIDVEFLLGVGVATPGGVDLGQVLDRFPVALVENGQDARAVGAGLASKDDEFFAP